MAVLAVSMMYWTQNAEEAMKKGGLAGLKAFGEKLQNQVSNKTLGRAMITIEWISETYGLKRPSF